MNQFQTRCICDLIRQGKEFSYVKLVSDYFHVDFDHLCNFTLDLYNYQRRQGLDKTGAKILSLNNVAEYAMAISEDYKQTG